jgi:hypothetical protein
MPRTVICPICRSTNEMEDSSVGCYVLCRNCPHRFYVEAPTLDGGMPPDESAPSPNVVPDYQAFERLLRAQDQGSRGVTDMLKSQQQLLLWLIALQAATGLLVLLLAFFVWRQAQ